MMMYFPDVKWLPCLILSVNSPQAAYGRRSPDAMRQRRRPSFGSHLKIVLSAEMDDDTMRQRSTRT